jgi:hypothetical protein
LLTSLKRTWSSCIGSEGERLFCAPRTGAPRSRSCAKHPGALNERRLFVGSSEGVCLMHDADLIDAQELKAKLDMGDGFKVVMTLGE